MVKFDIKAETLLDAFKLNDEDLVAVVWFLNFYEECCNVAKTIERVWVDETISDNAKSFIVFSVGRYVEFKRQQNLKRKED